VTLRAPRRNGSTAKLKEQVSPRIHHQAAQGERSADVREQDLPRPVSSLLTNSLFANKVCSRNANIAKERT
jgi:hypothetical protein